jgi:F-type H+-transporting ATPase subunit a
VSLNVVPLTMLPGAVGAEGGEGFETPGVADFWWPLVGGDSAWAFTRPALVLLISVGLLTWFIVGATGKLSVVPTKRQFMVEGVYNFVRNTLGRDIIGSKDFLRFLPLLFTLFTLILTNNVFGIVPFIQYPTFSRLGFPLVLTVIVYLTYHYVGIKQKHGILKYLAALIPAGLPGWLKPIMFVLEFLTYFVIRPLTLALRLMGNMLAGHLMLLVFILGGEYLLLHGDNVGLKGAGVLSMGFAVGMTFFELLIEFLQAFIFTLLAALYLSDALSEHH